MPVNTPSKGYLAIRDQWQRCRDAYAGTDAVKDRGEAYLPKLEAHKANLSSYDDYKTYALWYNATARTVDGLAGAIFQKPPELDVSAKLKEQFADVTQAGESFDMFALRSVQDVLTTGRYGILVDMAPADLGNTDARPYWAGYQAEDILSVRTERRAGDEILTRVVLREKFESPDGEDPFACVSGERYRVLELDAGGRYTQTVFTPRLDEKGQPKQNEFDSSEPVVATRRTDALTEIPFQFIGPTSRSPRFQKPPLLDLVDVNLSHYRTMADLEHGRRYVAVPTPWIKGDIVGGKEGDRLFLGAQSAWHLDKDGAAGMLEFTGQGLQELRLADSSKRDYMAVLGARLLEDQPTGRQNETATAVGMRHAGEQATLRTIAKTASDALSACAKWHDWWLGSARTPQESSASITLNDDFTTTNLGAQELTALFTLWQGGAVDYATLYRNLKRGGYTRAGVSAQDELAAIAAAQPEGGTPPPSPPEP